MVDGARFRILSLDGGGAKGMFTLGVLEEVESALGRPCAQLFDLVYGTSTGSIICALIALGHSASDIKEIYLREIPSIMGAATASGRTAALRQVATRLFGDRGFDDLGMHLGIVATRTDFERPMIFKASAAQAFQGQHSFVPGFGASLADAIVASCAARPFFDAATVSTTTEGDVTAIDGGFSANNPNLFALIDATQTLGIAPERVDALSVGAGAYPIPRSWVKRLLRAVWPIRLLETTLSVSANSMEILSNIIYRDIRMIRVNERYSDQRLATSLLESRPAALQKLASLGREAFRSREDEIIAMLSATA